MAEKSVKRILMRGSNDSPLFASGQFNPTFPPEQVGDLRAGCPSRMWARGAIYVTARVTFKKLWLLACESWMKRQQRRRFGMNMTRINVCGLYWSCNLSLMPLAGYEQQSGKKTLFSKRLPWGTFQQLETLNDPSFLLKCGNYILMLYFYHLIVLLFILII